MKLGSIVFAGLMLAVGLVYEIMALNMPLGRLSYPGPGLFPMIIGILLIATALGCLLQEILSKKRTGGGPSASPRLNPEPNTPQNRNVVKTYQLIALMVAYALALKTVGFLISIVLFLIAAIRIFGNRRWFSALAIAGVVAGISYVSFVLWLKVPLPLGILDDVF